MLTLAGNKTYYNKVNWFSSVLKTMHSLLFIEKVSNNGSK